MLASCFDNSLSRIKKKENCLAKKSDFILFSNQLVPTEFRYNKGRWETGTGRVEGGRIRIGAKDFFH